MRRALLGLAFLLGLLAGGAPARAAEDFCQYGHATALLLIDRTTAFDDTDRSIFLGALDGLLAELGPGDRLVAYTMTGAYTASRLVFDRCKPACPDDSFFGSLLSTCRPVLARSEYRGFVTELAATLAGLLKKPEETAQSDLFRTVADVTCTLAGNGAGNGAGSGGQKLRQVFVFSDLIENSTLLPERVFRRLPVADILRRLDAAGIKARLDGASVRVIGFGRDDAPGRAPLPDAERARVQDAWDRWLLAGGAASVNIGFR